MRSLLELANEAGDGLVVVREGRFVYFNDAFAVMTGRAPGELTEMRSALDLVEPADRERVRSGLADPGRPLPPTQTKLVRPDGSRLAIEFIAQGLPGEPEAGVLALVRDLTAGRRAEQERALLKRLSDLAGAAADAGEALAAVLEAVCSESGWRLGEAWMMTDDGILRRRRLVSRDEASRVAFSAPHADREFAPGEGLIGRVWVAGRPIWVRDVSTDQIFLRRSIAASVTLRGAVGLPLLAGDRVVAVLAFFMQEHGREDERFAAIVGAAGGQIGALVRRSEAVSALRESEEKYRRAYEREQRAVERLERAEKVKNAFLSALAHDVRNPLAVVLGMSEVIQQQAGTLGVQGVHRLAGSIHTSAARIERLLTSLLDVERITSEAARGSATEAVDLASLIGDCAASTGLAADRLDVALEISTAETDPLMLGRIVQNLFDNAQKYAPEGTPVKVRARCRDHMIELSVADSGPGIPEQRKAAIFDQFERGGLDSVPGSGLGLYLVAEFARLLGGRAWVEDGPGGGAVFSVRFPARCT